MNDLGPIPQIEQRLREKGMPVNTKLTWTVQPEGRIFHKKEKKEEEFGVKGICSV